MIHIEPYSAKAEIDGERYDLVWVDLGVTHQWHYGHRGVRSHSIGFSIRGVWMPEDFPPDETIVSVWGKRWRCRVMQISPNIHRDLSSYEDAPFLVVNNREEVTTDISLVVLGEE